MCGCGHVCVGGCVRRGKLQTAFRLEPLALTTPQMLLFISRFPPPTPPPSPLFLLSLCTLPSLPRVFGDTVGAGVSKPRCLLRLQTRAVRQPQSHVHPKRKAVTGEEYLICPLQEDQQSGTPGRVKGGGGGGVGGGGGGGGGEGGEGGGGGGMVGGWGWGGGEEG